MKQRGFAQIILILIVLVLVAGGAYYVGTMKKDNSLIDYASPSPVASPSSSSTTDETVNWKTYTNESFSFQYPSELTKESYNAATALFIDKTESAPVQDSIRVDIVLKNLNSYQLIDNPGGFIFRFDSNKKEWIHKDGSTSEFVPKRWDGKLEAYTYTSGDVKCIWTEILIPYLSGPKFVQIINTVCGTDDIAPDVNKLNEQSKKILSTFKFTP